MRLKVNEAIAQSEANGNKVLKQEIAKKLFSGANENTQRVNMSNLCRGKTQRIKLEWINIICHECDCTPNFLFGFE